MHNDTTLLLGLAVWNFFRDSACVGCKALIANEAYIRQSPLPYGIYPLRTILGQSIQHAIGPDDAGIDRAAEDQEADEHNECLKCQLDRIGAAEVHDQAADEIVGVFAGCANDLCAWWHNQRRAVFARGDAL